MARVKGGRKRKIYQTTFDIPAKLPKHDIDTFLQGVESITINQQGWSTIVPKTLKHVVTCNQTLGSGSYGQVLEGFYCVTGPTDTEFVDVAVKEFTETESWEHETRILLHIMRQEPQDRSRLVHMYGVQDNRLVLKRYAGSLYEQRPKSSLLLSPVFQEIMEAISQLHAMHVLHGDIKSENLLVDKEGHIYLCDFSLSRFCYPEPNVGHDTFSTLWYRAPEIIVQDLQQQFLTWYEIKAIHPTLELIDMRRQHASKDDECCKHCGLFKCPDTCNRRCCKNCPRGFTDEMVMFAKELSLMIGSLSEDQDNKIRKWLQHPTCQTPTVSYPIDVWSLGCMALEMIYKLPQYTGPLAQLQAISALIGSPTRGNPWLDILLDLGITPTLPEYASINRHPGCLNPIPLEWIKGVMAWNAADRWTIEKALQYWKTHVQQEKDKISQLPPIVSRVTKSLLCDETISDSPFLN